MANTSITVGGRTLGINDIAVVAAGVLTFIFGFLHFFGRDGLELSGWSSGFFGSFGLALCFLAGVLVLGRLFVGLTLSVGTRFGPAVLTFLLATLGAVFLLLKVLLGLSLSSGGLSVSLHRQYGLYLALAFAIVETVFAFLAITTAGEQLPSKGPAA